MSLAPSELAVVAAIDAAGLGWTRGVDLLAGPLRPGRGIACFAQSTGGPSPALLSGDAQQEIQTVQVSVWSSPDDYATGIAKARALIPALHRRAFGGYYHAEVREPDPAPIGRDDSDRHGFAINVELHGIRRP